MIHSIPPLLFDTAPQTPSASRENPGIVLTENISTVALLPLERMLDVVRAGSEWGLFPSGWEIGWKLGGCAIFWAISVKLGDLLTLLDQPSFLWGMGIFGYLWEFKHQTRVK